MTNKKHMSKTRKVCVFLTEEDYQALMETAYFHKKKPADFLRAAINSNNLIIPEVNLEKWQELARSLANLNQIARALNRENPEAVSYLKACLDETNKSIRELREMLVH